MPQSLLVYALPDPLPENLAAQPDAPLPPAWLGLGAVLAPWPESAVAVRQFGADAPDRVVILGRAELLCSAWQAAAAVPTAVAAGAALPCAVSLVGPAPDAHTLAALLGLGLTGWWPDAVLASAESLAAALTVDRLRWAHDRAVRADLARLQTQIDERKWVDRAKGVLMSARGMGEDEAFRLLRGASMHAKLRVGEVSRSVIEAAQWADAINRAGQLRMLSQRLVKLAAQRMAGADARRARTLLDEAMDRAQDNLDRLDALLPKDAPEASTAALARAQRAWQGLRTDLQAALVNRRGVTVLGAVDQRAEALLDAAEALTEALEAAGARRALHIINLCGRQRMRVQRLAKDALLAALLHEPQRRVGLPALMDAFEAALRELGAAPLSSEDIRAGLAEAGEEWLRLLRGLRSSDDAESQALLAGSSDALLDIFDRLTAAYEHSLQVIMS